MPELFIGTSDETVIETIRRTSDFTQPDERSLSRILSAARSLHSWDTLSVCEAAAEAIRVQQRFEEFFSNVTLEPIFTVDDDPEASQLVETVKRCVTDSVGSELMRATSGFTAIQSNPVGEAIHRDPSVIHALRYFTGIGEITFELLASSWLHDEGYYPPPPTHHAIEAIQRKTAQDEAAAKRIAHHLIREHALRPRLELLHSLTPAARAQLVDLLSVRQLSGRLSKYSGHKAEMIVAQYLADQEIQFEPQEKLHTLGTSDISVQGLPTDRKFDIVIPSRDSPQVLIQCAFYNSNTGSVASKTVRETAETRSLIVNHADARIRNIKLLALVDGPGWIAMKTHLRKLLILLDDIVQLRSLSQIRSYLP